MTPSLPTVSNASAMILPTSRSLLAEMVATFSMSALPLIGLDCFLRLPTTASTASRMPRASAIASAPLARFLYPSRKIASASTVAVVVPSPAVSDVLVAASLTSFAPMFSYLSLSSISSATVTPSLVMVGAPQPLSMTAFRPRGPRVAFTARDSFITPSRSDLRASVSKDSILAAMNLLLERDQDFEFRLDEQAVSAETHSAQGYWQWVCRDIHKGGEQPSTA